MVSTHDKVTKYKVKQINRLKKCFLDKFIQCLLYNPKISFYSGMFEVLNSKGFNFALNWHLKNQLLRNLFVSKDEYSPAYFNFNFQCIYISVSKFVTSEQQYSRFAPNSGNLTRI